MESIEKLREWLDYKINRFDKFKEIIELNHGADPNELYDLVDEIEAEIAERYMELPTDADGVPIKMWDKVLIPQCYEGIVVSIEVGYMETLIGVDGHDGYLRYGNSDIRHVKPRTIEDVLEDFGIECDEQYPIRPRMELIAEYANEIRELMGVRE